MFLPDVSRFSRPVRAFESGARLDPGVQSLVLSLSAGRYFMSTESAEQVLIDKGVRQTVDTVVKDGDTVCVQGEGPYGSLYASVFHPGRSYSVILNGILGRCGKVLYIR